MRSDFSARDILQGLMQRIGYTLRIIRVNEDGIGELFRCPRKLVAD
jgi:hypothetical protein